MSGQVEGGNVSKGKGKGKGGPPPPAPSGAGRLPKSSTSAVTFKAKTVEPGQWKAARSSRLHLAAGQQLIAAQETDGHFEARSLALKLDRLWSKLMTSEMPGDPCSDLSAHPSHATVFIIRLFECFLEKSGHEEPSKRDQVISWFGSGVLLGNRWMDEALSWMSAHHPEWRQTCLGSVDAVLDIWFATDSECKLPHTFIDDDKLQAKQAQISEKFASSQQESLRREQLWADCMPVTDIIDVPWTTATATRWCFGGGGGCFLVRVGNAKLLVKGSQDEGDVLAHELAKMLGVRTAALRFISPLSEEFNLARSSLICVQADEPEHGQRISLLFTNLQKTGCPLMVMEFVPGGSLQDRLGSEALSRGEEDFMRKLGHIIAMDTLMNNWDRAPALHPWPSAGNLGNVLVTAAGDVVAIDQAVQLPCEPQLRAEYYRALRTFVEEVAQGDSLGEGLERIRKAIQKQVMKWTGDVASDAKLFEQFMVKPESTFGVTLDRTACRHLLTGVRDIFSRIAAFRAEFQAKRVNLVELVRTYFAEVEGEHHGKRIDAATTFIEDCMSVVEAEGLYKSIVQATVTINTVFPKRKFVSNLQ